jgi:hypothetical protein
MSKLVMENILQVSTRIESLVQEHSMTYIDACVFYCEKTGLEIEYVGEILEKNQLLKNKIQEEAEQLNFIKKTGSIFK